MNEAQRPSKTDFGAPIVAGPIDDMLEARRIADDRDDAAGIYWENGTWYVHGHHVHETDQPDLTTYGKTDDAGDDY